MNAPVFVDSNVFLHALDDADPSKQRAAQQWRAVLWKSRMGRISFQVLNEFYVNALRLRPDASDQVRDEVRDLLAWHPVITDAALLELSWKIQDRYRLAYRDALIVAASRAAACCFLLTENLQAGQALDGMKVINPFLTNAEDLR